MARRHGSVSGLCLILLLAFSIPCWAQSVMEATLTGTVASGQERLPGVTVKITSPSLVSRERTVMTDTEGRFVFLSVPPGTYVLSAMLQGFRTYSTRGVVLHAGDKVELKVAMQIGAYEEAIVVTGVAPVVDTKSSTVSTTFSDDLLQKLPTARSAFYDLAITAPGMASVGADESWLTSPSAYGSAANENIFLVNGVNATNPRGAPWGSLVQVNYDTVEEVKVISVGAKAEYGSFSGAAIDVLTKSGSNDIKGSVAGYSMIGNAADNAATSWGGTTKFGDKKFYSDPADQLTTVPDMSREGSLTIGGALLRDRIWFYGAFNKIKADTKIPLWQPLQGYDSTLYDFKLTGDLTPKQRAWLAYHYGDSKNTNTTWGATWDPTMGYDTASKNHTLQAQYQWVMSDRNLFSGKYLGFKTDDKPNPMPGVTHPGYINWWKWIGTQSIGVNGGMPNVEAQKSKRQTLQVDHTHYAADFLGQHEVKYGIQYTTAQGNWEGGYFQGYANFAYPYPYNYGPATSWWWNGPASWQWGTTENPVFPMYNVKTTLNPWLTVRKSDSKGAFIDDSWSVTPRVTVNLGLRYDNMSAKYGEGAVYAMPNSIEDIWNPTKIRSRAGADVFDFKTWSPRLGLAWTLTDDNKTVLSAHVGRYYAPLGVETLRRFGPDMEPTRQQTWRYDLPMSLVDLNHNGYIEPNEVIFATRQLAGRTPTTLMSSGTRNDTWQLLVAPGTKSPSTDEYEISLQRQIGSDMAIEGTYIYKKTDNLISLRPYNTATGDFYDWTPFSYKTWTGYNTQGWEIASKDYNGDGVIDVADSKWVLSHMGSKAVNMQDFVGRSVNRTFQGLQFVLTKRMSNRWQGQASVNYATSDGVAGRTVSQNWYIDGPMIMDTPFGSSMNDFQNNLSGPLPMTPKWMVKASGSYTIPLIETDFGLRYRYDSGRPFWPTETIPAFASWMSNIQPGVHLGGGTIVATDPNHPDYTPATSIFDLSVSKGIKLGAYETRLSIDVLNAFNSSSPNRIGWKQADYGRVYGLVSPRVVRAGVKFMF